MSTFLIGQSPSCRDEARKDARWPRVERRRVREEGKRNPTRGARDGAQHGMGRLKLHTSYPNKMKYCCCRARLRLHCFTKATSRTRSCCGNGGKMHGTQMTIMISEFFMSYFTSSFAAHTLWTRTCESAYQCCSIQPLHPSRQPRQIRMGPTHEARCFLQVL